MDLDGNRLTTILRLSRRAFSGYKKQIVVLIILGFIGGILEGIGVNALIPLFSFVLDEGQGGGDDAISQVIEGFFSFLHIDFSVPYLLIFIILLFAVTALLKVYIDYLKIKITTDYENNTRRQAFKRILRSDWLHLIKQKLGHLENILLIDSVRGAAVLQKISTGIMLITSLFVYLLVAVNIDFVITLTILILGLVIFLVLKPLNFKLKKLSYSVINQNKDMSHHVNENTLGIKTVKSMWVMAGVADKGYKIFDKLKDTKIKLFVLKSIASSFIRPVGVIFICLIFAFTYDAPDFNFAALLVIVYLTQRIFVYIQQLQQVLNDINENIPYLRSTLDYQDQAIKYEEENKGRNPFVFKNALKFNDVSFTYTDSDNKLVFSNVSFETKKGEIIGIVGPSGSGKTTLVDLILRLLKPQSGSITLDGNDISGIDLGSWRENIGYVSQDMFLINDTIANNIRFYDPSITDEQIRKAAEMANITEFVDELPAQFETEVGDRGIKLSAGQRQRIVIARVLARNPELLVLDEATSALDNVSETKIHEVIKNLKGHVTVLVIAHRLSTVMDSDKLIVLNEGKIVEQGTPEHLLKDKNSYFSQTYNLKS